MNKSIALGAVSVPAKKYGVTTYLTTWMPALTAQIMQHLSQYWASCYDA